MISLKTHASRQSYADAFVRGRSNGAAAIPGSGATTVYIVHAWDAPFTDMLDAVLGEVDEASRPYIWCARRSIPGAHGRPVGYNSIGRGDRLRSAVACTRTQLTDRGFTCRPLPRVQDRLLLSKPARRYEKNGRPGPFENEPVQSVRRDRLRGGGARMNGKPALPPLSMISDTQPSVYSDHRSTVRSARRRCCIRGTTQPA